MEGYTQSRKLLIQSLDDLSRHLAVSTLLSPSTTDIPEHIPLRNLLIKKLLDQDVPADMIR
jgi:hypothetical protein